MKKIAIGCDPNAEEQKQDLIQYLTKLGYDLTDMGSEDPIYAHTAIKVAEAVANGSYDQGLLLCGTGLGMSIAANKVKGCYAALCTDIYSAERARKSNNANVACFGAFTLGIRSIEKLAETFLASEFEQGCSSQPKVDCYRDYDISRG
ncbi:MAG: RpiB/LacA/LacB family sugar-phosphate isomerase [Eubacteriales bacterium]|nr:RpiB/LacA/LacB family sugar-phosphate isomerase [Eubacteriales bacterium]MDO5549211.1 RpiB/LacA/LacB family sugar-phosphate isomerase [Eubacteriales bacterium]